MKFIELIDIESCDSTVIGCVEEPYIDKAGGDESRWYLVGRAFVKMSDCSRWVEWEMGVDHHSRRTQKTGYNIEKITKAIDILTKIKQEMERVQALFEAAQKEVDEHNAPLKKDYYE